MDCGQIRMIILEDPLVALAVSRAVAAGTTRPVTAVRPFALIGAHPISRGRITGFVS